jgi:PEP-CTERM motif
LTTQFSYSNFFVLEEIPNERIEVSLAWMHANRVRVDTLPKNFDCWTKTKSNYCLRKANSEKQDVMQEPTVDFAFASDGGAHQRRRRNVMMKRFLLPALLLACAAVGTAQADSVTYTSSTVPTQEIPFDIILALPKFNTNLGTLTGISFTVSTTVEPEIDIQNNNHTSATINSAFASIPVTATGPDGTTAMTTSTYNLGTTIVPPGFNQYFGSTIMNSATSSVTGSFSAYEGPGNFDTDFTFVSGNGSFGGTTGANKILFGGGANAGGFISVTYTYTPNPIPEPSAIVLAGIALAGLGVMRRRFRRFMI